MDIPFEHDAIPDSTLPFSGFDSRDELERMDLIQEIAERRAQLECAETLRRARAL
jgi:16S rRNA C1402 (ribose-2'-O) methylase RsmI